MPVTRGTIRLDGVGHSFPHSSPLFSDISWTFQPEAVCALAGPSGCGKSTLLAIIAGMVRPTYGSVHRPSGARVGWVFQNPHGASRRSVLDHVALPRLAQGESRRESERSALDLLDEFGLSGRVTARFSELSGGEAQRLMLARAVSARFDALLVDEPTAQLDPVASGLVTGVIGRLAHGGATVVVATHDPATRRACADVLTLGSID